MKEKEKEAAQNLLQNHLTTSQSTTDPLKPILKDQQEDPKKINAFKKNKQRLQDQTQDYMYAQSSKCSSVSRKMIYGIIGTIWIISFQDGQFSITNGFLFSSLMISLLFLLTDVIHYYLDSRLYEKEIWRMDNDTTQDDLDNRHEPWMDLINKISHSFLIYKFIFLICSSAYLIIGIFQRYVVW